MRAAAPVLLAALLCAGTSRAQDQPQPYRTPQATEDQFALGFLIGRYVTPVSCKKTDGSTVELESSIGVKPAPDSGGGNAARITFFGIDMPDLAYCYNVVERRVLDRRGSILVHFQTFNRADKGLADFKIAAKRGPLEYPSHRGEVTEKPLGSQGEGETRTLSFDGGASKLVVEPVPNGTDGAKLLSVYPATAPIQLSAPQERKRLTLRFFPVSGDPFVVYVIDDPHGRK